MNNAELIKALRCPYLGDDWCDEQKCTYWSKIGCMEGLATRAAADALEAAEKRIAELSLDCELFQQKCMELGAQMPKEGEWIDLFGHDYKCSVCGEWYRMDGTPEQEDMNYCPNCGARMKGEQE